MNLWNALMIYGAALAVMSVVTFVVFAWDKRRAKKNRWRVSERTLHTLELLGGWPGAWLAMRWVRHKSQKKSYRAVFIVIVTLHLAAILMFWMFVDPPTR